MRGDDGGNVQGDLQDGAAEDVRNFLERASAGAARVVARRLLDTVVREAKAWEGAHQQLAGAAAAAQ